jgi:hypothetical protein
MGGGWNPPIGQEIACHFSHDHTMVTKFLDFIHKHPKYVQGSQVIFLLSWQVFQKFSRDRDEIMIFWDRKPKNQLSFEVYNVCVAKKMQIS